MIDGTNIKMATTFAHAWTLQKKYFGNFIRSSIKSSRNTSFNHPITAILVALAGVVELLTP